MRTGALLQLVGRDLRRSVRSFGVAALGIAVGVATLSFFLALSAGMRDVVLGRIFPIDRIEVVTREEAAGSLVTDTRRPPRGIDAAMVSRLRALSGVRAAFPKMRLLFPSSGRGGRAMFNRDIRVGELVADGIDPSLVADEIPAARFADPLPFASNTVCRTDLDCTNEDERCDVPIDRDANVTGPGVCSPPVPALVSPYLLEIFNGAIAPSHGLRRINPELFRHLRGVELEWDLGRASLGTRSDIPLRRVHARIVGISRRALDLGITVPLEAARRFNRTYGPEESSTHYTSVVVQLRHPSDTATVTAAVEQMGLSVRTSGAQQMGLLVAVIGAILALVSIIVVVVASLNIAHVFLSLIAERRGELGLLRALGATRRDVRSLVLGQAAVLGFVSSAIGLALARVAAWGGDRFAARALPPFPFKPEHWFVFTTRQTVAVLLFGVGACVVSALLPAIRASRVQPASALAGGI